MDDGLETDLADYQEVMCEWVGQGSGGDSGPEAYLGKAASEAEDWESWHRMRGETLCLGMPAGQAAADHVCRLARAHWRRSGVFVIDVKAQPRNHEPWKQLRAQVLGSSASQRLLRKRRVVTNAPDAVRYKAAGEEGNQVFLDVVPEECPVMPEPRGD